MNTELRNKIQELAALTGITPDKLTTYVNNTLETPDANDMANQYRGVFIKYQNTYIFVKDIETINNNHVYKITGNMFTYTYESDILNTKLQLNGTVIIPVNIFNMAITGPITSEEFMETFADAKFLNMTEIYANITEFKDYAIELPDMDTPVEDDEVEDNIIEIDNTPPVEKAPNTDIENLSELLML